MYRLATLLPQRPNRRPPLLELDYRPPAPWPGSATPPDIVDMQTYADVHRWANIKMVNYIVGPRENHAVVPNPDVFDTMQRDAAVELFANNAEARIAVTEIALQHVLDHPEVRRGPVCFVTLVPACYAFPLGDDPARSREANAVYRTSGRAANFDLRLLRQTARQALGDIPFLGMCEVALYHRWGPEGRDRRDWGSWHCHLLTWGIDQQEISGVLASFRARHASMMKGIAGGAREGCARGRRCSTGRLHAEGASEDDARRLLPSALEEPDHW